MHGELTTTATEVYSGNNWNEARTSSKSEVFDRYDDMMKNFAEMINGKENPYSYDYELNLYKLILKSCGEEI